MGHLFSRALKHITQCTQSRSQQQQQQRDRVEQSNDQDDNRQSVFESIPVGQSIDSADYAAFEETNDTAPNVQLRKSNHEQPKEPEVCDNKQDVEGAVIKIQALIRGHLTRKALKDAQQTPPVSVLGQSQFDAESLIRNPPSAIFLPTSPLNLAGGHQQPNTRAAYESEQARTPLESIAEVTETQSTLNNNLADDSNKDTNKLAPLRISSSPSLEYRDSVSPVPSEANASIDLNCDTPASASLYIMDHHTNNVQIASVLHNADDPLKICANQPRIGPLEEAPEQLETQNEAPESLGLAPDGTSESLESEEAAAIRIQSAFRGYRTRKNSPYRTRSLNSAAIKREKNVTASQGSEELFPIESLEKEAQLGGRRISPLKRRDSSPEVSILSNSVTTTEEDNLKNHQTIEESDATISAALESVPTVETTLGELTLSAQEEPIMSQRPSIGAKSDISEQETDSSAFGGALSLNEDTSTANVLNPIGEERKLSNDMMTDELELEAKRLVDEMCAEESVSELDLNSNQNGPALEDADTQTNLDEDMQRVIEFNGDGIERRDTIDQASIDHLVGSGGMMTDSGRQLRALNGSDQQVVGGKLETEEADRENISGRSSPAENSSPGGSSSDEDANNNDKRNNQPARQQQAAKNRKKNRNKRKNKK